MDSQRTLLIIALLVLSFFLYQNWLLQDAERTPGVDTQSTPEQVEVPTADTEPDGDVPAGDASVPELDEQEQPQVEADVERDAGETITVETDKLRLEISLTGGDVVRAELLEHAETLGEEERYTILYQRPGQQHIAQSGLFGADGIDSRETGRPTYTADSDNFTLDGDELIVPLHYESEDGSRFTKLYRFTRGDYAVRVDFEVENASDAAKNVAFYGQLKQTMTGGGRDSMFMPTYRGAAYSSSDDRYDKYSFSDIESRNLNVTTEAGWVAMMEHYFVTAWVPDQTVTNRLYTNTTASNDGIIGFISPSLQIPAGETATLGGDLYFGPKDQERLAELAEHLNLTVDYGFLWFLAQPIYWLLSFLHGLVGNWGFAIILVTLVVKAALYPLTKAQYTSMAKMRMIAPRIKQLKERFGDDRQKMSEAMMKMYKEEKVNPLGGCLPLLLQLPIFLALYWVLLESPEIRHADFLLWINDLSSRDPYFILPLLMGGSMYLMQRLQPTPVTDPMQQKILQYMPLVFTVFFMLFPAGLVLYWLTSNLISIAQMLYIYKQLEKKGIGPKKA